MKFGLFVPQGWRLDLAGIDPKEHWATMLGVAKAAEDGPFDSIWVFDHFHTVPVPTQEATHEAWTLMAAYAAATSRVKLGQMCTCMAYRNPAYLAKVAATVDVISGGRAADGHRGRLVRARMARLRLRLPQRGRTARHARRGRPDHAPAVDDRHRDPRRQALPGRRRHRPAAAAPGRRHPAVDRRRRREEDPPHRRAVRAVHQLRRHPDAFEHKSEILEAHCREVGTDYGSIVRSANYNVVIGETEKDVQDRIAWIRAHLGKYVPAEVAESRVRDFASGPLVGTPEQIAEKLRQLRRWA